MVWANRPAFYNHASKHFPPQHAPSSAASAQGAPGRCLRLRRVAPGNVPHPVWVFLVWHCVVVLDATWALGFRKNKTSSRVQFFLKNLKMLRRKYSCTYQTRRQKNIRNVPSHSLRTRDSTGSSFLVWSFFTPLAYSWVNRYPCDLWCAGPKMSSSASPNVSII